LPQTGAIGSARCLSTASRRCFEMDAFKHEKTCNGAMDQFGALAQS
jgi:hypothetical protein